MQVPVRICPVGYRTHGFGSFRAQKIFELQEDFKKGLLWNSMDNNQSNVI
jgi:hypothetical protein